MKILLIMPEFFDYPQTIINQLEKNGHIVDFVNDRPSNSNMVKALIRLNRRILSKNIERYAENILRMTSTKKYDLVLLISGQSLSFNKDFFEQLKIQQENAEFVLYQWDSLRNFPYIKNFFPYFDRCYSFDRIDCINNNELVFLPLFYSDKYKYRKNFFVKYDFCFIGTAQPKKLKNISDISGKLKKIFPKQYLFFYLQSKLVYIFRKFTSKEFRKFKMNDFKYKPLMGKEFLDIYFSSKCVLDSPQKNQNGLTIRVIEALGARKKIITTNKDVINYDFFKEENIYVYQDEFDFENIFFKKDYEPLSTDIYSKYSLSNWLKILINIEV